MIDKFLNNRFYTLYLIPFVIGSLAILSFPPFNYIFFNFVIFPIFFYLIIFIKKKSKSTYRKKPFKKNLFIFGTSLGFGFYLSGIHWITNSLTFDENFKFLIPFGLVLIPLFLSLFFSILIVLIGPLLNLNFNSIFLLSGGLALSDYIRSKILSGFPWNLWSYSFSGFTEIIQILNKIGLFAFNLIAITIFLLPVTIFFKIQTRKKLLYLSFIPAILFILYIFGDHSLNQNEKKINLIEEKFNIKVISPNFALRYGLGEEEIEDRLQKLIKYSDPNKKLKTLFIWPEGVFSGYSYREILYLREIFSKNFGTEHFILFGVNKASKKQDGFYNSLIIVNNKMEIIQEYKKQKLVPFGEFLPFEKILRRLGLKKITEGHGSFLKGTIQKNLIFENLNILPLICYEIIFTELTQKSDKGTNLIINVSEDGWFGNSIGPYQHFSKGVFRAVEQNTFLIRSANKGISAIVNNKGEIVKKLDLNEAGNIEFEVPLIQNKNIVKNKNDLIFFILLITYIFIFKYYRKSNDKK